MELLKRHILHWLTPLQEAVIHGKHRYQPLLGHTAGHSRTVALRDTHVERIRRGNSSAKPVRPVPSAMAAVMAHTRLSSRASCRSVSPNTWENVSLPACRTFR